MKPTVESILSALTLEEKISLLAGSNGWLSVAIPEKGVPCMKTTDGPNGARGSNIDGGKTAACFPAACSVAATFDVDLARRVGVALGEETITKGAHCLLGPTVCIHRHPLGGRNFESFSEDPLLSGHMAIANIRGLQSTGVSATVKHFAVNEQETQRLNVNAVVSERALREIYLKPFELVVKHGKPWAIMTAYNKINGYHADSNEVLLKQVLRGDWGWDGLVMSDWGGVNSTAESINAGVDLEMPGPSRWRKIPDVLAAIKAGEISEATINERAHRVLGFLQAAKCFENPIWGEPNEQAVDKPEHRALIREAGAKGIVLLKNQNQVLPLTREKIKGKRIALYGYAKECLAHGGGSASVSPHYKVTVWDAFHEAFEDDDVELLYSQGAHTMRQLPVLTDHVVDSEGNPGFTCNVYDMESGVLVEALNGYEKSQITIMDGYNLDKKEIQLTGVFQPPETTTYYFTLSGLGPSQLIVNDDVILDQGSSCEDTMGFLFGGVPVPLAKLSMEQGNKYKIQIKSLPPTSTTGRPPGFLDGKSGVRVGCVPSTDHDKDILSEAVALAKTSDYSIIFTGHDPSWETEGQDQAGFNLPRDGSQDRLIAAVAAVCPRVIVVNSTGVAVAMPWLDHVQGILQAWFPGQEAGHSIVDVLTGAQSPEGHLPCTFPKRIEDCPAYGNFPGDSHPEHGLQVAYKEGLFIGYRHFDRLPRSKVNFPFGFGLSYTTFDLADLVVREISKDGYALSLAVSNTGDVKGATVVQVYAGRKNTSPEDPLKVLVGFKKVTLGPGTSSVVEVVVNARDLASWDEGIHEWVVEAGDYIFSVGNSAVDIAMTAVLSMDRIIYGP
ncbi:glycoside hydrolase superfamily [Aspergillus granulosus]|uniref:beta-glucosidase n=1 Tax=Aspergillus granulosus TaxID=176169 RepID=A0ABR4GSH1_9EURO